MQQTLIKKINALILDDGYTEYSKLPADTQDELTALKLIEMGDTAYEAVVDNRGFDDVLAGLIAYLLNPTNDKAFTIADTLHKNASNYLLNDIAELFNQRADELEYDRKCDAGLKPFTDHVNGETRWAR